MIEIIKTNWKITAIVIFLLISLILSVKLINSNGRLIIYKDSIKVQKNKAGELYAKVNFYQISEKELKQVNSDLYAEVNKLKDKPLSIETVSTSTGLKDVKMKSGSIDTTFSKGNSITMLVKNDSLKELKINTKLYISQTEKDGKLYLNARSDFPNLTFTNVEGYSLNALPVKPKRLGIGVFSGVNYQGKFTFGIGLSYNIIRF